jgi:hypothetical protein
MAFQHARFPGSARDSAGPSRSALGVFGGEPFIKSMRRQNPSIAAMSSRAARGAVDSQPAAPACQTLATH